MDSNGVGARNEGSVHAVCALKGKQTEVRHEKTHTTLTFVIRLDHRLSEEDLRARSPTKDALTSSREQAGQRVNMGVHAALPSSGAGLR